LGRVDHASPLWTLQRLCFGPDVAADPSDRGENRDLGTARAKAKGPLVRPQGAECAAVLAPVKGKPPLTRRWPPATLDHRGARPRPDAPVRTEGWLAIEQRGATGCSTNELARYPRPMARRP
jgi:hypothetical protein